MKSSTFGLGLRYAPQNVIVNCLLGLLNTLLFVDQLNWIHIFLLAMNSFLSMTEFLVHAFLSYSCRFFVKNLRIRRLLLSFINDVSERSM